MEPNKTTPPWRVILKYTLLQIPGLALFSLVLILAQRWIVIPAWLFASLLILWILKDFLMFSVTWRSYDIQELDDSKLMNVQGVAFDRLDPSGYIRIQGELWRSELTPDSLPVEKGESVQVVGRDNLVLKVRKAAPPDPPLPPAEG